MPSKKYVQHAHISKNLKPLHTALITILGLMNHPQNDEAMVRDAGISLDGALFPLLVGIQRLGPIGVVELADRTGRDHTTVSRQVAKLEDLGLVRRQTGKSDRRVREAVITPKGQLMSDAIDAARERKAWVAFENWSQQEFDDFVRLICKFAQDMERVISDNEPT